MPVINVFPVEERELYIVKETAGAAGTPPATVGVPVPILDFKPADKPVMLWDESEQGSMGDIYGAQQGPLIAGFDLNGNIYGDTFPHFLYNLLGDYTSTGTSAAPAGTTNAGVAVGALALPVASGGASFTSGMYVWIEDAGSPAANEVCLVGSGSTATSVVLAAPGTRFAHLTATPFTNTTFPYNHYFSLLNGLTGAANGAGQPPTHTLTDRTGIPATGLAAQYSYACMSEITIVGHAEKLFEWSGKGVAQTRQIASSPVGTVNVSSTQAYPAWRSAIGVGGVASGGTLIKQLAEWSVTLGRAVKPYFTDQALQVPYVIARGKQSNTGKLTYSPAIDESSLIALLANSQPQLQFVANNGLSGANQVIVQIDIGIAPYESSDLEGGSELFGYTVPFRAVHTAATFTGPNGGLLTGASGGKGAVKIQITNATPTY